MIIDKNVDNSISSAATRSTVATVSSPNITFALQTVSPFLTGAMISSGLSTTSMIAVDLSKLDLTIAFVFLSATSCTVSAFLPFLTATSDTISPSSNKVLNFRLLNAHLNREAASINEHFSS